MPTPDELRAQIDAAREDLRAAITAAPPAAWERRPADGSGEDAWSARQAAEHVAAIHVLWASEICAACGYPGLDPFQASFETPQAAVEGLERAVALSQGRIKYVSETDLAMRHERLGTVAEILARDASHLRDHAAQIRTASGS